MKGLVVETDKKESCCHSLLSVCVYRFPWVYAYSCTVNTYVCVCFCVYASSPLPTGSCVLACGSQQHCNQTITAQGNSALFKQLLFPPLHQNNNYSTILVNHKPQRRLRRLHRVIRRERRSSATLGQHPRRDESQTKQFRSAFQA